MADSIEDYRRTKPIECKKGRPLRIFMPCMKCGNSHPFFLIIFAYNNIS